MRVGCFCNIGGCQEALGLSHDEIQKNFTAGRYCWSDEVDLVDNKRSGAVRVSLGRQSGESDVIAFLDFLKTHFLDRTAFDDSSVSNLLTTTRTLEGGEDSQGIVHELELEEHLYRSHVQSRSVEGGGGDNFTFDVFTSPPLHCSDSPSNQAVLQSMYIYPIKSVEGFECRAGCFIDTRDCC